VSPKKTILIIDDEEDLRDTVEFHFKSKGFNVVTAMDGLDGLKKLETVRPDLIILDMNMPRMNGLEFYRKIEGKNGIPQYPVLVLTARANMEELFRSLDVDGFMAKPFELDELLNESKLIISKNSGLISIAAGPGILRARRICIVENHHETLNKLAMAFMATGYIVNSAQSGASAIRRMTMDAPDIAVISLGLKDISGDVVIGKLHNIPELKNTKYILYSDKKVEEAPVTNRIAEKDGIARFVEFNHPNDLIEASDDLFK